VDAPIPFTLRGEEIHLKAVPFTSMLENGVLYVPLKIFRETSSAEIREAYRALPNRADVKAVVLDLRGNPGGLLEEGIGVSNLFLPSGTPVVETRGRAAGQDETYNAGGGEIFEGLPVVVLVDGSSASASEIVAGALQDHDRALVIGMPSYGKGSVQTLYKLSGGNVLRLTTARWFTPSGRSIQKEQQDQGPVSVTITLDGGLVPRPDTVTRPTFRSASGRTLYGGGGIIPDLEIFPDTLTTVEQTAIQSLYRGAGELERAIFNYAVRYNQAHPGLPQSFVLSPAELEEFMKSLPQAGVVAPAQAVRDAERFLRYRLTREIAQQAGGAAAEFEKGRPYDTQLVRALEVLRGASSPEALFRSAEQSQSAARSSPAPVANPGG
jgi:carboxyl-terminal processing protease